MKVLGIVGSMRKNKNTHRLVKRVIEEMKLIDPEAEEEFVYIADKAIAPCRVVCSEYCKKNPYRCSISDDATVILDQMVRADALVIGVPLYFRAPPAKFQAFAERLISIFFFRETQVGEEESPLSGKPCGLIGVAEYSNPHLMLEYLHDFCTLLKMNPVLLKRFPYLGVGGQGDVERDVTFNPFERSKDLAKALMEAVRRRG